MTRPGRPRSALLRRPVAAAVLVLVAVGPAGLLAGCGAPQDASTESFCSAARKVQSAGDRADNAAEEIEAVKQAYAELEDVGTPADIPQQARDGFEVIGQAVGAIPDDASQADLEQVDERVGAAGQDKVAAFFQYVSTACTGAPQ